VTPAVVDDIDTGSEQPVSNQQIFEQDLQAGAAVRPSAFGVLTNGTLVLRMTCRMDLNTPPRFTGMSSRLRASTRTMSLPLYPRCTRPLRYSQK